MRRSSLQAAAGRGLGTLPRGARRRRAGRPLGGLPHGSGVEPAGPGRSPVNDMTMPHLDDRAGAVRAGAGEPAGADRRSSGTRRSSRRRRRLVGFALGARRRLRARRSCSSQSRILQRGVHAVHRRVSQTIPILAIAPMVVIWVNPKLPGAPGLGRGRGDRRVPDLLPGRDQHAARPAVGRPARARADALLRGGPLGRALEAARPDVAAVPLLGAPDRGDRERRRRDHRRAAVRRSRTASAARSSTSTSTTRSSRRSSGRRTSSPPLLGIVFFLAVVLVEKLVVRRAPEHVA